MREWEEAQRATVAAFVQEALAGSADTPHARLASAFFDLPTYRALRSRGADPSTAAETVAEVVACLIERDR